MHICVWVQMNVRGYNITMQCDQVGLAQKYKEGLKLKIWCDPLH